MSQDDVAVTLPAGTIDSHVHFWDPNRPDLYPYLAPGFDATSVGVSHGRSGASVYQLQDHLANTGPAGVRKTVHINATGPLDAYLPEMERVSAAAEACPALAAIQGKVDLRSSPADIVRLLDEYQNFPLFRGIRLLRVPRFDSPEVRTVLEWLTEHGRTLDLGVHPHEMADAAEALAKYPALDVVVEHAGWPLGSDIQDPASWREGLARLAGLGAQVRCKISGVPMAIGSCQPAQVRPWVLTVVELFGPERSMFGSNFPVDNAVGSYAQILGSYYEALKDLGAEALGHIFTRTASSFYAIPADQDSAW